MYIMDIMGFDGDTTHILWDITGIVRNKPHQTL